MAIRFRCVKCSEELKQPGGLLFGPPASDGTCVKYHLCTACYEIVLEQLRKR